WLCLSWKMLFSDNTKNWYFSKENIQPSAVQIRALSCFHPAGFGPGSEFGFRNPLHFFDLLAPIPKSDPNQVRHTLGFGYNTPSHDKNLLHFFGLLPRSGTLTASHNRQVEGSSPSGPTIFLIFIHFLSY